MELQQILVLAIFAAMLILSALRLAHPAAIALAAALGLAVWLGPATALAGVRADVLVTAAAVMVLAGFFKRSGVISWLALKTAKNAGGRPRGILVRMALLAFVSGAVFGPGASVLVLPVALLLAVELDVAALPFIVTVSWSSLLGGTAVLTAQPGNLWVGAQLSVNGGQWLIHMMPYAVALLAVTVILALVVFRRSLRVTNERRARVLEYDESRALENKPLTAKTLTVMALVVIALVLEPLLHVQPMVVVLAGALLLSLLAGRTSVKEALAEIDGGVLLWYAAVLSVVGIVSASGDIAVFSHPEPLALLWGAAVAGSFVDPGIVAGSLAGGVQDLPGSAWSLAVLGAAIGGGATLWNARSTVLNAAVKGPSGPGWTRFVLWGVFFAAVNLLAASGLWLLLR